MINVAAVVAQFGAYYLKNPENLARLRNMLYQKVETIQYFQNRPTSDTVYRCTQASLDRVVQPFQKTWTPIGTLTFLPNVIQLYKLKIDKEETPDDLEATYEGFLADMNDLDRANWPFVKWFMENHIMPAKQRDLEMNEYFKGVYAAPVTGVAGPAGTAMNGLEKTLSDYAIGGRSHMGSGPVATGVPSTDAVAWCTQVETFAEGINTLITDDCDNIFMSRTLARRYIRGRRIKYNSVYKQEADMVTVEDHTNLSIVGLKSHEGSNLIWTTTPANRIRPTKKAVLADTMKIESVKRSVAMFTDWWEALNFEVPEFVVTNDQIAD